MPRTKAVQEEVAIPVQGGITTLIGYDGKRSGILAQSPNAKGYEGAVPIKDCLNMVFNWKAVEGDLVAKVKTTAGRGRPMEFRDEDRKVIVRQDTGKIFQIVSGRYSLINNDQWFTEFVLPALGDTLSIGGAGTLNDGAVAWCSIEQTNSARIEGVHFRSSLMAVRSLDGTLSTMYHLLTHNLLCDNFMAPNPMEAYAEGRSYYNRGRSTKSANAKPLTNEQAVELIKMTTADFKATVELLVNQKVSTQAWHKFLDLYVPIPADDGRGKTLAENKRQSLEFLWKEDERVSPWKGTAYGVVTAVNTYVHHEGLVRNAERTERNLHRAASGKVQDLDANTLALLNEVQGR